MQAWAVSRTSCRWRTRCLRCRKCPYMHRKKFTIPFIGITGSNGKTTTKEMLASILKQKGPVLKNEGNLNNHIGVPLTLLKLEWRAHIGSCRDGHERRRRDRSARRLVNPDVGVITNIGPAHLEFLGSMDNVAEAKAELLGNIKPEGTAVLNADDRYFDHSQEASSAARFCRSASTGGGRDGGRHVGRDKDYTDFTLRTTGAQAKVRLRAVGRHNIYNALAAAAAAKAAGMTVDAVKYGLDDFMPVAMRSEVR